MKIRNALVCDVKSAQRLVNEFASRGVMLSRSLNEFYEHIRDYFVCEDSNGDIVGVCALHVLWEDLAEIKSLAVKQSAQKKSVGAELLKRCIKDAGALGINRVFALTYVPGFFIKHGFTETDKSGLPQKIWGDCLKCPKFPDCDEQAVILNIKEERSYGIIAVYEQGGKPLFLLIQHNAGHWAFPKGHANAGETPIDTAKREMEEETSVTDYKLYDHPPFIENYIVTRQGKPVNKTVLYFLALVKEKTVKIQESEIADYKWADFSEALATVTFNEGKELLLEVNECLADFSKY
ncbi:MAG: N-acetyltransferase [Nitrospirae bacterium]|nr:N-acetyltransferase [Nitrospirota bacterium]